VCQSLTPIKVRIFLAVECTALSVFGESSESRKRRSDAASTASLVLVHAHVDHVGWRSEVHLSNVPRAMGESGSWRRAEAETVPCEDRDCAEDIL
jgi:hypothetical protein